MLCSDTSSRIFEESVQSPRMSQNLKPSKSWWGSNDRIEWFIWSTHNSRYSTFVVSYNKPVIVAQCYINPLHASRIACHVPSWITWLFHHHFQFLWTINQPSISHTVSDSVCDLSVQLLWYCTWCILRGLICLESSPSESIIRYVWVQPWDQDYQDHCEFYWINSHS